MAHHRQQSRKKNAPGFVTTQPNLGAFEFFRADKKPSAVANDQGATKSTRYPVGYRRAKIGPDCPGNDNTPKIQMSLRGEKGGGRNHNFTRNGEDRAFHCHQDNDPEISPMQNPARPNFQKMMHIVIPSEVEESRLRDGFRVVRPKSKLRNSKLSCRSTAASFVITVRYLGQTIFGLLLSVLGIGLNLLKPWPFKLIVDRILPAVQSPSETTHVFQFQFHGIVFSPPLSLRAAVAALCLALVVIQLFWGILNFITNYIFVKVGLQALLKLRTDLYAYLQSLSLKYHDARRSSDSSFRVAYDSQSIQTIYNKGLTNIFGSIITLIGTFAIMMRLDWLVDASLTRHCSRRSSARFIFSRIVFERSRR